MSEYVPAADGPDPAVLENFSSVDKDAETAKPQITITVTLSNGQDHKHTFTVEQYIQYGELLTKSPVLYIGNSIERQTVFWMMGPTAYYNAAHVARVQIDAQDAAEIEEELSRDARTIGFQTGSSASHA